MLPFRLLCSLLFLALLSTSANGSEWQASGSYNFSTVALEFNSELTGSGNYICLPIKRNYPFTDQCPLEAALAVKLNTHESVFFSLSTGLRISMVAMSLMKALENYQKVACGSGSCCQSQPDSSQQSALMIKKSFIAVYLAMGLVHMLEDHITDALSLTTDYSYSIYHFTMLAGSLFARAIDCNCKHPLLNKHVGMIVVNALMLLSPTFLFH